MPTCIASDRWRMGRDWSVSTRWGGGVRMGRNVDKRRNPPFLRCSCRWCGVPVWWSPKNGRRTTPNFRSWPHSALSPADAQNVARAEHRNARRRSPGASGALRLAAHDLACDDGAATMTRRELLDRVAAMLGNYAEDTR